MKQQGKRELLTDLSGVDVSLFRLERDRYAKWQTVEHYYWWTRAVQKLGGAGSLAAVPLMTTEQNTEKVSGQLRNAAALGAAVRRRCRGESCFCA